MGCHTWAAKKVNRTIEEGRALWIASQENLIEKYKEYCEKKKSGIVVGFIEQYSLDSLEFYLKLYERQLAVVKKGLCNVAVMNRQNEHSYYIPDRGFYVICDDFHDMFRVGGYPDNECFSLQETLDFIKRYEIEKNVKINIHTIDGHQKNTLEEFWDTYPDAFIHFG